MFVKSSLKLKSLVYLKVLNFTTEYSQEMNYFIVNAKQACGMRCGGWFIMSHSLIRGVAWRVELGALVCIFIFSEVQTHCGQQPQAPHDRPESSELRRCKQSHVHIEGEDTRVEVYYKHHGLHEGAL